MNIKENDSKTESAETIFLRNVKGCTKNDLIRNNDVLRRNWLSITKSGQKINRMRCERVSMKIINCNQGSKRDINRQRKW